MVMQRATKRLHDNNKHLARMRAVAAQALATKYEVETKVLFILLNSLQTTCGGHTLL